MKRLAWLGLILCLLAASAQAHKASDSYLSFSVQGRHLQGQWSIGLRDLDYALGLDEDDDRTITWGELLARRTAVIAYALPRLQLIADSVPCKTTVTDYLAETRSDGGYVALRLSALCAAAPSALDIDYRLFGKLDPQHRGIVRVNYEGRSGIAVFGPEQPRQRFQLFTLTPWREFLKFAREGIRHIWTGFDHILFLIALLLPAVLQRREGHWQAVTDFEPAFWNVLKVVTAFTLAHSITLSLAALEVMKLPARWVESIIAASIVIGALNNLFPLVRNRLWIVAFAFGLIHGFGFASELLNLGLPRGALLVALLGFNIGVEAGQLAIVGIFLPLAFGLRRSWVYQRAVLVLGSLVIAVVASIWMAERMLNFKLLPF